jgi:archaemetzincin
MSVLIAVAAGFVVWVYGNRDDGENGGAVGGVSPAEGKICVIPIGEVPPADVAFACDVLAAHLGREAVVFEPLPLQESYYYPERGQYGAAGFLRYVQANAPPEAFRVFGLTAQDITIPDLNFMFGMGGCPGKCAVLSTRRLDYYGEGRDLRYVRFAKLLIHESGHTFGLLHCRQPRCAMKFADGYGTLDYTRLAMCERCEKRFCEAAALDAGARRERLAALLKKYGLWTEAGGREGLTPPPPPADLSPEKMELGRRP